MVRSAVKYAQIVFGLSGLILSGDVRSVWAYIPPSQFIIKTWVNKHSGAKTIRIKNTVTGYESGKPSEIHFKETTLINLETSSMKSWASDDTDKKLYTVDKKLPTSSLAAKLLLSRDVEELTRSLRQAGIPIRVDSELSVLRTEAERMKSEQTLLSRWNSGYAWVIGATTSRNQIWFEKDTFLPMRLVHEAVEWRFESFRFAREFPYPRMTHLLKNGDLVLVSQLQDLAPDTDPSHFRTSSPGMDAGAFTDQGNRASSGLKDLIRTYYEHIR